MRNSLYSYWPLTEAAQKLGCTVLDLLRLGARNEDNRLHLGVNKVMCDELAIISSDEGKNREITFSYGVLLVLKSEDVAKICAKGFADVTIFGGPYWDAGPYDDANWNGFVWQVKNGESIRVTAECLMIPAYELLMYDANYRENYRQGYDFDSKWAADRKEAQKVVLLATQGADSGQSTKESPPGRLPRTAAGILAINAAWEIECETNRAATNDDVMARLQSWADNGLEPETLIKSEKSKHAVEWRTKAGDKKSYDIDALRKTLSSWMKSRAA